MENVKSNTLSSNGKRKASSYSALTFAKFIVLSIIGIYMFFVPVTINGNNTVPLDHITTYIMNNFMTYAKYYALGIILIGTIVPFVDKSWNKTKTSTVFSMFKILGSVFALLVFFNVGPKAILDPNFGPFLFNVLAVQVGLLIPIGSIFLTFLIGYGFIDAVGILMRPVMRPIWKTPGLAAVDAVASFVGSSVVGLLITNSLYKERKFNTKEACIVATGFSTVAATFMIVVAKTLDIMDLWTTFFWTSFVVTFTVSAVTVRLRPLRTKPETYYLDQEGVVEAKLEGNLLVNALDEGLRVAEQAKPIHQNMFTCTKDAIHLVMGFLPNFMSMGLIALLLAEYTPVFDIFGYVFYPITLLLQIPEPMLAAKATSLGLAEMYLPALVASGAPLVTRFIIGVGCISGVLMFTTTIPGLASTEIPLSIGEMVIIWFQRAILSLLLVTPIAYLLF